jgi:hypothetical protein
MTKVIIPYEWCKWGFDAKQETFRLSGLTDGRLHVLEQFNCQFTFERHELVKHLPDGTSYPYVAVRPCLTFETDADAVLFKLTEL